MGCKQSRPEYSSTLADDVKQPECSTEGVECSEVNEEHLFSPVVVPEATPRDLRKIREELFARDSLVAIASSATAETLGTMDSSDGGIMFGSQKEVRFIETDSQQAPTTMSTHSSKQYHYPAALYDDMKTVKHFVPTFNMASTTHHFPITDRVPSNPTQSSSSEDSESTSGFDELDDTPRNFPVERFSESDHLIDTMSMFLEPLGANSERSNCMRKKPPQSLGALVDALTYRDEEDDLYSNDGGSTAAADADLDHLSCSIPSDTFTGASAKRISETTSSSDDLIGSRSTRIYEAHTYHTGGSSAHTTDALPSLKAAMSAEILSDMKTQAMMANQSQSRGSVLLSFSAKNSDSRSTQESSSTGTRNSKPCLQGYCENSSAGENVIQYHRSDSVIPKSSDAISVCSKWMQ